MEAENRHLKTLLNSLGISTELLQQYVQLAEQGNFIDGKVAIPAMHQQVKSPTTQAVKEKPVPATSNPIAPAVMTPKTPENTAERIDRTWKASDPPLCKCSPGQRDLASGPVDGDVLNTTLCAIAEELINQYNTRGTDLEEIRQRLWSGFQSGVTGDGCRVQNNVLFEVLDEISHNV